MLLTLVLCTTVQSQASPRRERKKPFADLSASAQRLRDTLVSRLDLSTGTRDTSLAFVQPASIPTSSAALVVAARSQIGTRYLLGAEKPFQALDCSALVRFVMSALRIDLPRTAREQAQQGTQVDRDVARLRPGDLLTFGRGKLVSHIGVYVGQGRFVHASTTQRQVVEASIEQPGTWFRRNWVGVRRVLASTQLPDSSGL